MNSGDVALWILITIAVAGWAFVSVPSVWLVLATMSLISKLAIELLQVG